MNQEKMKMLWTSKIFSSSESNVHQYLLTHVYNIPLFTSYGYVYGKAYAQSHLKYYRLVALDSILLNDIPLDQINPGESCLIVFKNMLDTKSCYKSSHNSVLEKAPGMDISNMLVPISLIDRILFPDVDSLEMYTQMDFNNTLDKSQIPCEILPYMERPVREFPIQEDIFTRPVLPERVQKDIKKYPVLKNPVDVETFENEFIEHIWETKLLCDYNLISPRYLKYLPKSYPVGRKSNSHVEKEVLEAIEIMSTIRKPSVPQKNRILFKAIRKQLHQFPHRIKESHNDDTMYDNLRDRTFTLADLRSLMKTYEGLREKAAAIASENDDLYRGLKRIGEYYNDIDLKYSQIIKGISESYSEEFERELLIFIVNLIKYNDQADAILKLYESSFRESYKKEQFLIWALVMSYVGIHQLPARYKFEQNWGFLLNSFNSKSVLTRLKPKKERFRENLPVVDNLLDSPFETDFYFIQDSLKYKSLHEDIVISRSDKNQKAISVRFLLKNEFGIYHSEIIEIDSKLKISRINIGTILNCLDDDSYSKMQRYLEDFLGKTSPEIMYEIIKRLNINNKE